MSTCKFFEAVHKKTEVPASVDVPVCTKISFVVDGELQYIREARGRQRRVNSLGKILYLEVDELQLGISTKPNYAVQVCDAVVPKRQALEVRARVQSFDLANLVIVWR